MAEHGNIKAGAARICITPSPDYFPVRHMFNPRDKSMAQFGGAILTDIYLRVLVIEDGRKRALIAVYELPGIPYPENGLFEIAAQAANISPEYALITCTHNHSAFFCDNPVNNNDTVFKEKMLRYSAELESALKKGIADAIANLRPAKFGIGRLPCYLNINRVFTTEQGKVSTAGFNPYRPADKELFVLRIDDLNGTPIAFFMNYATHNCTMVYNNPEGRGAEISSDVFGVCCLRLEQRWNDKPVALFTSGAAGDLNPIVMSRFNKVAPDGSVTVLDYGKAARDILDFLSTQMEYAALNAINGITEYKHNTFIWADRRFVKFPADALPSNERPPALYEIECVFSVLVFGDMAITATNGEIYTQIGIRLKQESRFKNTVFLTHAGQRIGYIKDDSGQGLAETVIKTNLLEMLASYFSRRSGR